MSEMPTSLKELVMAMGGCDGDCDNCSVDGEETPVRKETLKDFVGALRSSIKLQDLPKLTAQELVVARASLDRTIPFFTIALLTRDVKVASELPHLLLAIIELQERGLEYEPADKFLELLYEIF